jgi:hypothetical protein
MSIHKFAYYCESKPFVAIYFTAGTLHVSLLNESKADDN